ncbi:MAG: hypothetical protein JSR64_17020 [Nitrospira sp.]|nr:hypothetical protein [Nitrospira sp.]
MTQRVAFSTYGPGPGETAGGIEGGCYANGWGTKLTNPDGTPTDLGTHCFAELFDGTALGGLQCGATVMVTIDGHGSGVITKADTGTAAVTEAGGIPRCIDLWKDTLPMLGITDPSQGVWFGTATVLTGAGTGQPVTGGDAGNPLSTTTTTQVSDSLESQLGGFLGLTSGESIHDKLAEGTYRVIEVMFGVILISAAFVILADMIIKESPTLSKGVNLGISAATKGLVSGDQLGLTKSREDRQGHSTKNVKDRQPRGMSTAEDRIASGNTETAARHRPPPPKL